MEYLDNKWVMPLISNRYHAIQQMSGDEFH
jgi:hypothetical protein